VLPCCDGASSSSFLDGERDHVPRTREGGFNERAGPAPRHRGSPSSQTVNGWEEVLTLNAKEAQRGEHQAWATVSHSAIVTRIAGSFRVTRAPTARTLLPGGLAGVDDGDHRSEPPSPAALVDAVTASGHSLSPTPCGFTSNCDRALQ